MFPFLSRYVLFPLHQRLTDRSTLSALDRLRESQRWTAERLQNWQEESLARLLAHASRNVPYYRDLFTREGLDPEFAARNGWARIPLMGKEIVREQFARLQAADRPRLFITGSSSGSTGHPITWHVDRQAESVQHAVHIRAREWFGLRLGDPQFLLWGRDTFQGFRKQLRDFLIWNKRALPGMEITEKSVEIYYKKLRRCRPRYLRGYPSLFVRFARLCQARGLSLKDLRVKAVITTAESLSFSQRSEIQAAYDCPVANEYGCSEVQVIAFECPKGSMHIQSDAVRVEFLREGRPVAPGEFGEIVVTDLTNQIMPVIRYKTGDIGRPREGSCSCGRTLPLMELTVGRTVELIKLPDGRVVHSEVFTPAHGSFFFKLVRDFHVIQETPARFRVQVVVGHEEEFHQVRQEYIPFILAQLGEGIEVTIERVTEIPRHSSGRRPYFVSCLEE